MTESTRLFTAFLIQQDIDLGRVTAKRAAAHRRMAEWLRSKAERYGLDPDDLAYPQETAAAAIEAQLAQKAAA